MVVGGGAERRRGRALAGDDAARASSLTDTRETIEPADELRRAGVVLELGGHRAETLNGADLIVLSPGVLAASRPTSPAARAAGVPVIGELELGVALAARAASSRSPAPRASRRRRR